MRKYFILIALIPLMLSCKNEEKESNASDKVEGLKFIGPIKEENHGNGNLAETNESGDVKFYQSSALSSGQKNDINYELITNYEPNNGDYLIRVGDIVHENEIYTSVITESYKNPGVNLGVGFIKASDLGIVYDRESSDNFIKELGDVGAIVGYKTNNYNRGVVSSYIASVYVNAYGSVSPSFVFRNFQQDIDSEVSDDDYYNCMLFKSSLDWGVLFANICEFENYKTEFEVKLLLEGEDRSINVLHFDANNSSGDYANDEYFEYVSSYHDALQGSDFSTIGNLLGDSIVHFDVGFVSKNKFLMLEEEYSQKYETEVFRLFPNTIKYDPISSIINYHALAIVLNKGRGKRTAYILKYEMNTKGDKIVGLDNIVVSSGELVSVF